MYVWRVLGVNAESQMLYVLSCMYKATRGGGCHLRSKVTKSLHKLSHVKRERSVLEGQEGTLMRRPWYHELFPGGYKVNPSDLANSVSLTRLPHDNRLHTTAKNSVWCLAIIVS